MQLIYLPLIVFASAIAVFFAQDLGKYYKKIIAIPGMNLLLPLFIASLCFISCESLILQGLHHVQTALHIFVALLQDLLPFQTGSQFLASALLLTSCATLPVVLTDFLIHRKVTAYNWKNSNIVWLSLAILLTTSL